MRVRCDSMVERLDWRGICRAYITSRGAIHQLNEGTREYHSMFVNTPRGTRYIVAEEPTLVTPRFVVFDVFKTQEVVIDGKRVYIPPPQCKVYKDLDHAIGTTVMQFDDMSLLSEIYPFVRRLTNIWKEWRLR